MSASDEEFFIYESDADASELDSGNEVVELEVSEKENHSSAGISFI